MGTMYDPEIGEFREVTREEAEQMGVEFVVCVLKEHYDGYPTGILNGTCHDCEGEIVFMPGTPERPHLCLKCALERVQSPARH